jgi:DNA-binding IclR family transcriptional regulator
MSQTDDGLRARQPKAVRSALAVLEEVARCGVGVTGQTVARNLGLPRSTTYRLLNILVEDGYLVRLPDLSGFALGRKVAMLSRLAADEERGDRDSETAAML